MDNLLDKICSYVVRDTTLTFQTRLFRLTCLTFAFVALVIVTPTSMSQNIPSLVVVGNILMGLFSLFCYWQSCRGRNYILALFVGMVVLMNPVWFFNAGMDGSVPYFFYPLFLYPMVMWRGKTRWIATIAVVLDICALLLLEIFCPFLRTPFPTPTDRIIDLVAGAFVSYFCLAILLWIIIANYDWEKKRHKEAEERLLRNQRMETLGALSAGIAHDFNNILCPVLLSIDMLREETSEKERQAILDALESNAKRGADFVQQLLTFSRGSANHTLIEPNQVISEMVRMTSASFPSNIQIDTNDVTSSWPIRADAMQIHQILLNLCVRARDAMPHGGTIKLGLGNVTIDRAALFKNPTTKPGTYVLIWVEDEGVGIPREIQDKILEAFFTTKPSGKGTDLGLATVQIIVNNHDGFIHVQSEAGKGTRFSIYLPALPGAVATKHQTNGLAPAKETQCVPGR